MGITVFLAKDFLPGKVGTIVLVLLGIAVYFVTGKILRIKEIKEIFTTGSH